MGKTKQSVLFLLLSALLVLSACSTKSTVTASDGQDQKNAITITSQGEMTSEPNTSVMNVEMTDEDDSAKKAQGRVETLGEYVKEVAKEHKMGKDEITTKNFHIRIIKDHKANKITGYRVAHTLEVQVNNTKNLGNIIDAFSEKNGILVRSIEYQLTDDKKKKKENEALSKAIQNAKKKAEVIAEELGVKMQGVQNVITSSVRHRDISFGTEALMKTASADANYQLPEDDVSVTSTVKVSFSIEQ